jgi:hypothetical protein
MCHAVTCKVCGKTTWSGCGQHINQVRRSVPASNWCNGRHTQAEIDASKSNASFFQRLFGR